MTTPLFLPVTTSNQPDFNRRVALAVNPLLGPLAAGAVSSFNTRTGAVTLLSADVTGALGYVPTSVTGLTGAQTVAAFKTGLSLVKGDVGLGSVDNTADANKNVLSATKLTTARTLAATGDVTWSGSFDGSANFSVTATLATANANVGSFGSSSLIPVITVDGKGRVTAVSTASVAGPTGTALTKADDTNVTATLGGTPTTALLQAVSITLGWTGQLAPGRGGTGIASYAVGDILYASGATALSKLADVATGNVLISGGVTTAPSWGKVGLTTHISGTLPVANGGTNYTGGALTTYTPTCTAASGSITTYSATGSYFQLGKFVFATATVTITNAGTASGYLRTTLPVAAVRNGPGSSYEANAGKFGEAVILSVISLSIVSTRNVDLTTQIAAGNVVTVTIMYEAA